MTALYSPDEQFWATIAHSANDLFNSSYTFGEKARFISANWTLNNWHWPNSSCNGLSVRQMCVFGERDLEQLLLAGREGFFFANKFDDSVDSRIIPALINKI